MNINSIVVNHHDHAGYSFVEFEGTYFKGCKRCGGTGHYSFNGFDSICYSCGNTSAKLGDELGTLEQAQAWCEGKAKAQARRDAAREAERLAKLAKRDAAWQALKDQHPAVWELLSNVLGVAIPYTDGQGNAEVTERSSFVLSLADKLWRLDEIKFTERQIEALESVAAKRVTEKAEQAATPAPEGRVVVTGEIASAKAVEGDYGTSYKILVKDDQGFKVWVSLPKAQADQAYDEWFAAHPEPYTYGPACWFLGTQGTDEPGVKGRRITFTATLTPSRDDVSFAFGNRPTKGAWI